MTLFSTSISNDNDGPPLLCGYMHNNSLRCQDVMSLLIVGCDGGGSSGLHKMLSLLCIIGWRKNSSVVKINALSILAQIR